MTNLLLRSSSLGLNSSLSLTPSQQKVDALFSTFSEGVSDWRSLAAMTLGGLAYRATKLGVLSSVGAYCNTPLRFIAPVLGLSSEVTVFRGVNQILSPHPSLLTSQSSWLTDFVNFASLKFFGNISRAQNPLLSHFIQDVGMVTGHHLAYGLKLATVPEGDLVQQLLHAEITNLQMGMGMSLGHFLTGGRWQRLEKMLELRSESVLSQAPVILKDPTLEVRHFGMNAQVDRSIEVFEGEKGDRLRRILDRFLSLRLQAHLRAAQLFELLAALEVGKAPANDSADSLEALKGIRNSTLRRERFLISILGRESRQPFTVPGVADFVEFESLKAEADRLQIARRTLRMSWAQVLFDRMQGGVLLADCNFGRKESSMLVMDHHGVYAQGKNASEQLLDYFEEVLRDTRGDVDQAIAELNIREVSTDNLGDGAWSVWIAQNQRRVLSDAALRRQIRRATHFEDFTAFGNNYKRQDPAVQLQAALFKSYGDNLRSKGISETDRFPPDKAKAVITDAMQDITKLLADRNLRRQRAEDFWREVDAAREVAREAMVLERSMGRRRVFAMYDLSPLRSYSIFAQWLAIPDLQRPFPPSEKILLQATLAPKTAVQGPQGSTSRHIPIIAIPNGMKLPTGKNLLGVLPFMNEAESRRVEALKAEGKLPPDFKPNFWFGREDVIIANPKAEGSVLSPEEIADVLMREEMGLFAYVNL